MAEVQVAVDPATRVATVTIDDAERRNALTLALVERIEHVFDELEGRDDVGAVVVTGAPPAFCAGADLSQLGEAAESGLRRIYEGFLRVARSPLPSVAAVNGAAVGAGMNLALVCDIRIAGRSARFDTRFLQLGLHPGGGHTWMLHRQLGPQGAAALVLFGDILDGDAAERAGLVWRTVDDADLLATAQSLAARAASAPAELVERAKSTLRAMPDVATHGEAVDLELIAQVWSISQPAFADRLARLRKNISGRSSGDR
jgi:enoyl-CoA hydratase